MEELHAATGDKENECIEWKRWIGIVHKIKTRIEIALMTIEVQKKT